MCLENLLYLIYNWNILYIIFDILMTLHFRSVQINVYKLRVIIFYFWKCLIYPFLACHQRGLSNWLNQYICVSVHNFVCQKVTSPCHRSECFTSTNEFCFKMTTPVWIGQSYFNSTYVSLSLKGNQY